VEGGQEEEMMMEGYTSMPPWWVGRGRLARACISIMTPQSGGGDGNTTIPPTTVRTFG
jgi:hypothetical protein